MNGKLRASDADRNAITEVLHSAYADGRLTLDEHDERVSKALAAKTFGELGPLTEDLVATKAGDLVARSAMSPVIVEDGADPDIDNLNTVMSTIRREGPWRIRAHSNANNFMGSVKLDLTEATFDAPVVEIRTVMVMGDLVLRVPEGTRIKDETSNLMGSTSIKDVGDPDATMPLIIIRGTNLMGDVKVRGPKKKSGWRKALGH